MNTIEIYRHAIKRTFADVFEISPDSIDVAGAMTLEALKGTPVAFAFRPPTALSQTKLRSDRPVRICRSQCKSLNFPKVR